MFAIVTTYNFDPETSVCLFKNENDALNYLKQSYERELHIDSNENGWDTEGTIIDDGTYAKIINRFPTHDDVTEFRLGTVYSPSIDV